MYNKLINFLLLAMLFFVAIISLAGMSRLPAVTVIHVPETPMAGTSVSFEATVNDSNISSLNIIVKECQENGVCFLDSQNVSMEKFAEGRYRTNITLRHSDATKVEYYLNIKEINGTWWKSNEREFNLLPENSSMNHQYEKENKTPGFEVFCFVISITTAVFLLRLRRAK